MQIHQRVDYHPLMRGDQVIVGTFTPMFLLTDRSIISFFYLLELISVFSLSIHACGKIADIHVYRPHACLCWSPFMARIYMVDGPTILRGWKDPMTTGIALNKLCTN